MRQARAPGRGSTAGTVRHRSRGQAIRSRHMVETIAATSWTIPAGADNRRPARRSREQARCPRALAHCRDSGRRGQVLGFLLGRLSWPAGSLALPAQALVPPAAWLAWPAAPAAAWPGWGPARLASWLALSGAR